MQGHGMQQQFAGSVALAAIFSRKFFSAFPRALIPAAKTLSSLQMLAFSAWFLVFG
jgi:hypothetical protein